MKKLLLLLIGIMCGSYYPCLGAEAEPFGIFVVDSGLAVSESIDDAFFAAFEPQQGDSLQKALLEQKALDDAQKEYEAQLQEALQKREKRRALREQQLAKYSEDTGSVSYKFRNRELRKELKEQQEIESVHALYREAYSARQALSESQLKEERASRKERVKAFALKQAEVTRQAVATQHEMLALCHDIEKLRAKAARYSNAHSSAMIKP